MIAEVRAAFCASLDSLPDGLTHGLFNYYVQSFYADDDRYESFHDVAERLGCIVDLFNRSYDERSDLAEDEWRTIQKLVSENAEGIDLEVLEHVMQQIVSMGKFMFPR